MELKEKDALLVMRGQPVHYGHIRLIHSALKRYRRLFLVLGSIQEFGTEKNPFTFRERRVMLKHYFTRHFQDSELWQRITIIGLPDIFSLRWPTYVLEEIAKAHPDAEIEAVFGGTQYDCDWFKNHFLKQYVIERTNTEHSYVSATMVREMLTYGDPRWMDHVPRCNWYLVAKKYNRLDMIPDGDDEEFWQAD